jgi:hypothetical protein
MIRGSDLPNAAVWTQTAIAAPRVPSDARTRDASSWFRTDAPLSADRISGDVSAAARGLSVEQHAAAVLAHLRGEPEAIA